MCARTSSSGIGADDRIERGLLWAREQRVRSERAIRQTPAGPLHRGRAFFDHVQLACWLVIELLYVLCEVANAITMLAARVAPVAAGAAILALPVSDWRAVVMGGGAVGLVTRARETGKRRRTP